MTNLKVLRASRAKPTVGDIFTMQIVDRFLFGRVILADLPRDRAPMPGAYLIYVYDETSTTKDLPSVDSLSPQSLLIPPAFINRMPWTKGYFERLSHGGLGPEDRLSGHCFRDTGGKYVDETGRQLSAPLKPCGEWGLFSYRYLDDRVSDALHIPRAPDDAS